MNSAQKDIYQRIFEHLPDALLVVDAAGRITLANAQAETLFAYSRDELIGQPVEILIPARFSARHAEYRTRFVQDAKNRPMGTGSELLAQRKNGDEFPADIMLSPVIINGAPLILCVVRDITERKAAEDTLRKQTAELQKLHAELKELASHDALTGLLNRRAFFEHADQLLKAAHRRKENAALLMIDLDHFKQINDRFGHAEGDHVLKVAADTLLATARENDIVARYGGEEFVVAILGTNKSESLAAAERLREAIGAIKHLKSGITVSIGVTLFTPPSHKRKSDQLLKELLDQADRSLYAAKHNGRNQVCLFSDLEHLCET